MVELFLVTWHSERLQEGKKKFVVREAFDDKDALNKVKRKIDKSWLGFGETFDVKRVSFNEDVCVL